MKKLVRIIMVNWYLFEAEEWKLRGNVALLGKNGSGKSSFIDALQYVMLGGHGSDWHPNAKASGSKRTRDVRSYVLGVVKDEDAVGDSKTYQPRESALCRLVLVFEDEETGEPVSMGAAIAARRSESKEQVEGFFILKGLHLTLDDLIQNGHPQTYDAMKARFQHGLGNDECFLFGREPSQFVEQLVRTLGPAKRLPSPPKYRRAFRQSIDLSGLEGSVSDFVKHSILDERPLNLSALRQSMDSYRNKSKAVEEANKQIEELERINSYLKRALSHGQRRAGYSWCEMELQYASLVENIQALQDQMESHQAEFKQANDQYHEINQEVCRLRHELDEITASLNQDKEKSRRDKLQSSLEEKKRELDRLQQLSQRLRENLGIAEQLLSHQTILSSTATDLLQGLCQHLEAGPVAWPDDPAAIDTLLAQLQDTLSEETDRVDKMRLNQNAEVERIRREMAEIDRQLTRLRAGESNLTRSTLHLIDALADKGISATPVCDLVEVADPRWQPAIEAFLRDNTEALIVPLDQAQEAVALYRQLKKGLAEGAVVVNTEKVQSWKNISAEEGTAAGLIKGDDSIAVTYVQRILGGITLVETNKELMSANRALTPDGMFARQGGLKRLKLPNYPKLGKGAREAQIVALDAQADEYVQTMQEMHRQSEQLKSAYDLFKTLDYRVKEAPSLTENAKTQTQLQQGMQQLEEQIAAINTQHLDDLMRRQATLQRQSDELQEQLESTIKAYTTAETLLENKKEQIVTLQNQLPRIKEKRDAVTTDEDYDAQKANELYEKLEEEIEKQPEKTEDILADISNRIKQASSDQDREKTRAVNLLSEFKTRYSRDLGLNDPLSSAGYRTLVADLLHDIRDIGLHERQQDVADALHRAQKVIRQDLAIQLRSNIEDMERRINELNRELNARPFSGNQVYQFHYERLPESSEFLKYVDQMDQYVAANTNSLFDEHSHINDHIKKILDAEDGDRLADYRNYYKFDITIKDTESNVTEKLSRRIGNASGGEHSSPFYVAIGASLASAYQIKWREDGKHDGGLSLFLADEAFEKMDFDNTEAAFNYLVSIGLQMFIAAPDGAEGRLRPLVDTILSFIREGNTAQVIPDYVTQGAKQLLKESVHGKDSISSEAIRG